MLNFKLLLIAIFLWPFAGYSQQDYAREVLNTLCAPDMHGRGYVQKGDSLASAFLASEYEKIGLKPFGDSYFQSFTHSVNSFSEDVKLSIDGVALQAGAEFLVHPGSGEASLEYEAHYISSKDLENKEELILKINEIHNKYLVFDRRGLDLSKEQEQLLGALNQYVLFKDEHHLAGLIELYPPEYKGLWSVSTDQGIRASAQVFTERLPKKIKRIKLESMPELMSSYASRNVVGFLPGAKSDSCIVVCAHYDHLGRMGPEAYFPGASDNASGTAMLLSLAKHFSEVERKYDMVFICFAGEEAGLKGSKYFVENPLFPLEKCRFVMNLDIMGTGDDGIQVVNGAIYKEQFDRMVQLNEEGQWLKEVRIRGERCNSDHCAFHEKGIPSFFVYTLGGQAEYHNIYDTAERLSLSEFNQVFNVFKAFLSGF